MAKTVQFAADVRRRFTVAGLRVTTSVLGRYHQFQFQGHDVTLSIPTASPAEVSKPGARTRKVGWRATEPDDPETTIHEVFDVDLGARVPARLGIDERAFSEPAKSPHATPEQARALDRIADEYAALLAGAWDHWQTTVRWVAGHHSVGRAGARVGQDPHGASTVAIYRRNDQRKIWNQTTVITVMAEEAFDSTRWQLLQAVLSSGQRCPVWFPFIAEAHQRLESFDSSAAIASAAIACETLVRSMFWLNVPQVETAKVRDLIDRSPVQAMVAAWDEIAGPLPLGKWQTSPIHRLFDLRNRLMHSGEAPASIADVRKVLSAATAFIHDADAVYCARVGLENWPARYSALQESPSRP